MPFDPSNPADVKAARVYFDAIEAEELELDRIALARARSGVDGPGMEFFEFMRLHNLPLPKGHR